MDALRKGSIRSARTLSLSEVTSLFASEGTSPSIPLPTACFAPDLEIVLAVPPSRFGWKKWLEWILRNHRSRMRMEDPGETSLSQLSVVVVYLFHLNP